MTDSPTTAAGAPAATEAFPTGRPAGCPFDPDPAYARFRAQPQLPTVSCPAGIDAILLTRYDDMRTVLRDDTASSRGATSFHAQHGVRLDRPADPGNILQLDGEAHDRLRRLLTREFTVARARALRPYLRRIIDEHIDAMLAKDGPVDLVADFALPIPSLVICELLDVPYADRDLFQSHATALSTATTTAAEVVRHTDALLGYLSGLVSDRLANPSEHDLIGRIIQHSRETDAPLAEDETRLLALILLIAGHDTTANQIALSALALLRAPGQFDRLRAELAEAPHADDAESPISTAVEELLRYLSVVQFGALRFTTEPVDVAGHRIEPGNWVINALAAGNRDEAIFPDADRIDLHRKAANHLAFGFGRHQCIGQQLARVELKETLTALIQRVPALRLAVPFEDLEYKTAGIIYGVTSLPVLVHP